MSESSSDNCLPCNTLSEAIDTVATVADVNLASIEALLARYELKLCVQANSEEITGSYWGDREAGIVGHDVFARTDTPVHSLLHESCHAICMTGERRTNLDRDAGGDDLEEAAVCYLQIVLANEIDGIDQPRLMSDMDSWGYSFRLGRTDRWFAGDAADARAWLIGNGLLNQEDRPTFRLRK